MATKNRLDRMVGSVREKFKQKRDSQNVSTERHKDLFDRAVKERPDLFGEDDRGKVYDWVDETSGIDSREQKLLHILRFCLLVGMGYFILGNIRPYIGFADQALAQWKDTGILAMAATLPVIGYLLTSGFAIVSFILGTILWAILQLSELLPTVLNDSPGFILAIISRINSWQKLIVNGDESKVSRQLKERYNSIPEATIEKANLTRAIAYLIDAAICFSFYSPIEGGWGNFQTMLLTNDWSYLKVDQVGYIIVTLFAVEALYWAYKLVTGIVELYFENN
jgi:hypothetical protein